MAFRENDLENLIIQQLEAKGFTHVHGDFLKREFRDVLLKDDLRKYLRYKYKKNNITENEINRIIRSLEIISNNPLYDANKKIFKKIVEGETFVRDDKTQKDFFLQLIDFEDINRVSEKKKQDSLVNIYKICNQVIIQGSEQKRIPDTILYINGLPLVVWEYKSTIREDATIYDAYVQLTTRYTRDIPELFKYNAFVVISDGINSKMGSLFADYEHFYAWRKVNENDVETDGIESLFTMINGLFSIDRILEVIRDFIYFPDSSKKKEIKIVCNYPQFFAATKIYKNVLLHKKPNGDGKGGTYFGTTGCGKSYGMLFLTRLLMRSSLLNSPTIILITDRTDLDDQLSSNFVNSKNFIGDKDVMSIVSRDDLKSKLKNKASGGVYLTTIQKFTESLSLLTNRNNVICISDEAHRSQLNLNEKIVLTEKEVKKTFGYAKYLHDSLPNATYIGFTGTPIEETIDVFGDIVESYTMKDSIKDGITVNLVYDGRFVKAILDSEKIKEIEEYYKECLAKGSNEYQIEESKKSISVRNIIDDDDILSRVAESFVQHYESRINEKASVAGKCMFVCADRGIAYHFWKIVKKMRPEWVEERKTSVNNTNLSKEELKKLKPMPMMKIIATRDKNDEKELYDLLGNDEDRKEAAIQFKDINSNFKIAIVVDMWLTGFDVPFLDTIYIDKLLKQEHSIIQTISRVNRAFPGKTSGLIVDYIGIKYGINKALKKYSKYNNEKIEGIDKAIEIVKNKIEILNSIFYKFDSDKYFNGDGKEKLITLNKAAEFIQLTKELEKRFMDAAKIMSKAFNLCNPSKDFSIDELEKIHFYMAVRSIIFKLTKGIAPDINQMNKKVTELIQEAIKANGVEELFKEEKEINSKTVDLFDRKYLEKINSIKLPNTKIKILQQLLNSAIDEFKKVNKIKAQTFTERLSVIVDSYNKRPFDQMIVSELLDDVAQQLISLMEDLSIEKASFEKLGINYEEKAFLDILHSVESKYGFKFPEQKNISLARKICTIVSDKSKYADWANRGDIKAELQADIIIALAEEGFPPIPDASNPEDYQSVYFAVIEQAENFRKYYN